MSATDEDDLGKDIAAAFDAAETPAAPASETPAADAEVPAPAAEKSAETRARDESGKFVKKDETEKPAAIDKNELAPAATATGAQPQASQPAKPAAVPAPVNWKGNGKVDWNRLPAHVQKEISEDYTRFNEMQGKLAKLDAAIGNRSQALAATYGSVEQGIQNLFAISDMATQNPQGFILWFAQQRGLDLTQLVQGAGAQAQQPAAEAHPLEREVHALRSQVQQFVSQQQTQGQSQLQTEIGRFAADPAHPYFNDVRPDMAALMQGGRAKDLSQAYEMAVWARPEIRESLLTAERQKALEANVAKVAAAKHAAGSITGAPIGAKTPNDEPDEDLDATIRRSVDRAFAA